MRRALPQRQLPFADGLAETRTPVDLLVQLPPGELPWATTAQLEIGGRLWKALIEHIGADFRDDPAGFAREGIARRYRVDESPPSAARRLGAPRGDPPREPEWGHDLQHGSGLPAATLLRTAMEDASVLATQPARSRVVRRPLSPAVEPFDLDLLGARIRADDDALAQEEKQDADARGEDRDGRGEAPRSHAEREQRGQLATAREQRGEQGCGDDQRGG